VGKFCLDKVGVSVALGVVFDEDIIRLVASIFYDEPARAFWDKAKRLVSICTIGIRRRVCRLTG
jgi:hypothetical protein